VYEALLAVCCVLIGVDVDEYTNGEHALWEMDELRDGSTQQLKNFQGMRNGESGNKDV
jgi:hypothetical protein